jgi:hypothetical protein
LTSEKHQSNLHHQTNGVRASKQRMRNKAAGEQAAIKVISIIKGRGIQANNKTNHQSKRASKRMVSKQAKASKEGSIEGSKDPSGQAVKH